jgi:hypothetical protein
MTWAPGEPMLIRDRLIAKGGWFSHPGARCFNRYRAPTLAHGDASQAGPWIDHVLKLYPNDANHIILYFAHRVQRPHEKPNHMVVLGGVPGIGKDALLEAIKRAIGSWNFVEVAPHQLLGRFNGFLEAVVLRISEMRDLGEVNLYMLYERLKTMVAAPPDVHSIDEKHLRLYYVPNINGTVATTNYKTEALYLPANDRRTFVAWSDLTRADFEEGYFANYWQWLENGGSAHVAAYLAQVDLSQFDPKAPPPKTEAFWAIVNAHRAPETAEFGDVLDKLGNPPAVTLAQIKAAAEVIDGPAGSFSTWLADRRHRGRIPHRMEDCEYVPLRNPDREDGLWNVAGQRQVVYVKRELAPQDQRKAAAAMIAQADAAKAKANAETAARLNTLRRNLGQ